MGWTTVERPRGYTRIEKLRNSSGYYEGNTWKTEDGKHEWLIESMSSSAGGIYGVMRKLNLETGDSFRTAVVILIQTKGESFSWKAIAETSGPGEYRYPKSLLKQLSPPEDISPDPRDIENMREWRKHAEEYHATKLPSKKLAAGDVVDFEQALQFTIGKQKVRVSRFVVREWGRKKRFTAIPPSPSSEFTAVLNSYVWRSKSYTVTRDGHELVKVVQ